MTKYHFIFVFFIAFTGMTIGQNIPNVPEDRGSSVQQISSNERDSTTIVENTFFDLFSGNPGKAALYGLLLPGGGQIYNRRWWKLPLVYGLESFLVISIVNNTRDYHIIQEEYLFNLKEGTSDVGILKRRRDQLRKAREYAWVFFIGGHLITIFEAFIDRHLMEFDVSDDLTFQPIITEIGAFNGITYTIPLNKKKTYTFKNLLE